MNLFDPLRLSSQCDQKIKPELKETMQKNFAEISVATVKSGDRWIKKTLRINFVSLHISYMYSIARICSNSPATHTVCTDLS